MIDYCPNCGDKDVEKLSDTEVYCPKCDQSFEVKQGKAAIKPSGRLSGIEQRLEKLDSDNKQIKKDLYGKEDYF